MKRDGYPDDKVRTLSENDRAEVRPILAELVRRYSRRATLVETSPNGVYDCPTVID